MHSTMYLKIDPNIKGNASIQSEFQIVCGYCGNGLEIAKSAGNNFTIYVAPCEFCCLESKKALEQTTNTNEHQCKHQNGILCSNPNQVSCSYSSELKPKRQNPKVCCYKCGHYDECRHNNVMCELIK